MNTQLEFPFMESLRTAEEQLMFIMCKETFKEADADLINQINRLIDHNGYSD